MCAFDRRDIEGPGNRRKEWNFHRYTRMLIQRPPVTLNACKLIADSLAQSPSSRVWGISAPSAKSGIQTATSLTIIAGRTKSHSPCRSTRRWKDIPAVISSRVGHSDATVATIIMVEVRSVQIFSLRQRKRCGRDVWLELTIQMMSWTATKILRQNVASQSVMGLSISQAYTRHLGVICSLVTVKDY